MFDSQTTITSYKLGGSSFSKRKEWVQWVWPLVQTFDSCTSRPEVFQCPVIQSPMENTSEHKPNTPMTYVASESKLLSVVRSSMHPCLGNWVAIGRVVVYYAQASQAFSAGIKWRHCMRIIAKTLASHLMIFHLSGHRTYIYGHN